MCAQWARVVLVTLLSRLVVAKYSTYSAVVVEYHPKYNNPNSSPNPQDNVHDFLTIISTASTEYEADIIVFPEGALSFHKTYLLPDPTLQVKLCNSSLHYDSTLIDLACASLNTRSYLVVNLVERLYNSSLHKNVYFNTDVVFDRDGALVARYRKIHLYQESSLLPSPDGALGFFDTDFGVRFGLLTCFDILFKTPGVTLASRHNVSHFITPTHWFAQLPFLTAVQEQYYWAYSLDVVLLAAQYNQPSTGSTGSGIYLGRRGPVTYNMTSTVGTFLLHARVPVHHSHTGNHSSTNYTDVSKNSSPQDRKENSKYDTSFKTISESTCKEIFVMKENLKAYRTELIKPLGPMTSEGRKITIHSFTERTICQNALCCKFSLNTSTSFSRDRSDVTRGDDYSQLYFRLAVFDGVRDYNGAATGGVQTCSIIPCVNTSLSSCGLRADSPYARPNTMLHYYQTEFVFESISIVANISNNNSMVGPNILLRGEVENNFGELLPPDGFVYSQTEVDGAVLQTLKTLKPLELVTFSLYGRLFNRDGQAFTPATHGMFNRYRSLLRF